MVASTSLIFQNKRHCFSQIPEKPLTVDADVGKRGNLGGWGWLRPGSDAKLFSSRTPFEFRPPKLDSKSFNMVNGFVVHEMKEKFFSLKSRHGLEMAALLYQRCLLPYVWKGELIMKAIISIVLSQRQRSIYDQGDCWLWQGKKSKNFSLFLNSTLLQVWAFHVFYLLDNTLSVGVFTLIKLVFEIYGKRQLTVPRRNGSREKNSLGPLLKHCCSF